MCPNGTNIFTVMTPPFQQRHIVTNRSVWALSPARVDQPSTTSSIRNRTCEPSPSGGPPWPEVSRSHREVTCRSSNRSSMALFRIDSMKDAAAHRSRPLPLFPGTCRTAVPRTYGPCLRTDREETTDVAEGPNSTFWNISSRSGRMNENRKSPCIRPMGMPTSRPSAFSTPPPDTPGWPSVKLVMSLLGVRWPTYPVETTMPLE